MRILSALLILAAVVGCCANCRAAGVANDEMPERGWATVRIRITASDGSKGSGSGACVDHKGGRILTAAHLFRGVGQNPVVEVDVFKSDRKTVLRTVPAEIVAIEYQADVALLKVAPMAVERYWILAPPGYTVKPGTKVYSEGCTKGEGEVTTIHHSVIKCDGREILAGDTAEIPGRSGGPLLEVETGWMLGVLTGNEMQPLNPRVPTGRTIFPCYETCWGVMQTNAWLPDLFVWGSPNCGPCRMFKQHYTEDAAFRDAINQQYRVHFIDASKRPIAAAANGILSLPTFVVRNGKRFTNYTSKELLCAELGIPYPPAKPTNPQPAPAAPSSPGPSGDAPPFQPEGSDAPVVKSVPLPADTPAKPAPPPAPNTEAPAAPGGGGFFGALLGLLPTALTIAGMVTPIGAGAIGGIAGIKMLGWLANLRKAKAVAQTAATVVHALPLPAAVEQRLAGVEGVAKGLHNKLDAVIGIFNRGGGGSAPTTFPANQTNTATAPAAGTELPVVPTRNTEELHQLLQLGKAGGRDPLLDSAFGMLAQAELQTRADAGDVAAKELLASLKEKMNQLAPLAVGT